MSDEKINKEMVTELFDRMANVSNEMAYLLENIDVIFNSIKAMSDDMSQEEYISLLSFAHFINNVPSILQQLEYQISIMNVLDLMQGDEDSDKVMKSYLEEDDPTLFN